VSARNQEQRLEVGLRRRERGLRERRRRVSSPRVRGL